MSRFGVVELVRDQVETMHRRDSARVSLSDVAWLYLLPVAAGVAVAVAGLRFRAVTEIISGVTILTGLLFGLLVHVFTLGLRIADNARHTPSSKIAILTQELRANVAYSCGVGLLLSSVLVVAAVNAGNRASTSGLHPLVSAFIAALGLHLALTLLTVLKRVRTAYQFFVP